MYVSVDEELLFSELKKKKAAKIFLVFGLNISVRYRGYVHAFTATRSDSSSLSPVIGSVPFSLIYLMIRRRS